MKKVLYSLLACLMLAGFAAVSAHADDLEDLKAQVKALQDKISAIEAKQAAPAPAAAPAALPGNLSFSGYFRGRFQAPEAEKNSFNATEVTLQPKWDASDKIHGEAHLWFYPAAPAGPLPMFYLESAMITVDGLAFGPKAKMIAGKARNFAYGITPAGPNRLVSNYSLYSESFTHARVTGLQFLNNLDNGKINWNVGLINGFPVKDDYRNMGIELWSQNGGNTVSVLAVGEEAMDGNDPIAISTRIGGNITPRFNMGLSAYFNKLDGKPGDGNGASSFGEVVDKTHPADATKVGDDHRFWGVDFKFKDRGFTLQGEYSDARITDLDYNGFQILAGYDFDDKNSFYIQYGQLNYDIDNIDDWNTVTAGNQNYDNVLWDKDQITLSYKHKLSKMAWLQLEHEINGEDTPTGVADVENDITFLEFFVGY